MKKNLAKRIVLGLLTGAVLMSSSVAWAEVADGYNLDVTKLGDKGFAPNSLSIGGSVFKPDNDTGCERSIAIGIESQVGSDGIYNQKATDSVAVGYKAYVTRDGSIALGSEAQVDGINSMALGYQAEVIGGYQNSVALGKGSVASDHNVVSVGDGGALNSEGNSYGPDYRRIVNVAVGEDDNDAVNVKQMQDYVAGAVANLPQSSFDSSSYYTKTQADATFVKINEQNVVESGITVDVTGGKENPIVMDDNGITVGTNSTRMDGTGFYVWKDGNNNTNSSHDPVDAIASMNDSGEIKGVSGTFSGNVTAANLYNKTEIDNALALKANADNVYKKTETYSQDEVNTKLADKADQSALTQEVADRQAADQNLQSQIDKIGGGAISGINQRLEKTNAKINKVGAGAAALAALHPLDYDPDDKLTFSAGMGNYAGENAAALGAFYRPNEKFMLSLGGTMGNGENMVNLGLSIGLDKPNGLAKLSKRELIQKVNAVEAENDALEDRVAKLEALVAQLASK